MPDPRYTGWKRDTTHLRPAQSSWNSGVTKTIRVPIVLADQILEYARALDSGDVVSSTPQNSNDTLRDAIDQILTKINEKLPGYRSNSASKLIKNLRSIYG
jgi:hypothetical protein